MLRSPSCCRMKPCVAALRDVVGNAGCHDPGKSNHRLASLQCVLSRAGDEAAICFRREDANNYGRANVLNYFPTDD